MKKIIGIEGAVKIGISVLIPGGAAATMASAS